MRPVRVLRADSQWAVLLLRDTEAVSDFDPSAFWLYPDWDGPIKEPFWMRPLKRPDELAEALGKMVAVHRMTDADGLVVTAIEYGTDSLARREFLSFERPLSHNSNWTGREDGECIIYNRAAVPGVLAEMGVVR
jgi:hypothetical protein